MAKRVVIDTDRRRGQLFKVSESGGRCYVYDVDVGLIFNDNKKIGEALSMKDALEIIRPSVGGTVRNIRTEDE